jgi:hypothetical protein
MTVLQDLVLFGSGAAAGVVNSVGGGGTLLCLPALLWTGAGMSGRCANATSTVALMPGMVGAALPYRDRARTLRGDLAPLVLPSLLGGATGAFALHFLAPGEFVHLLPWLVLAATILYAGSGRVVARLAAAREGGWSLPRAASAALSFATAFYGGFFGAGIGILLLAMLTWMGISEFHRANALKLAVWLLLNLAAAAVYVLLGFVRWPEAALMAAGSLAGGYGGASAARHLGERTLRAAVVVTGIATSAGMLARAVLARG